jgi:hypothetical protein
MMVALQSCSIGGVHVECIEVVALVAKPLDASSGYLES